MDKNNSDRHLPALFKSTMALSLATVGFISAPFFGLDLFNINQPHSLTQIKAAALPDLSSFYYNERQLAFQSTDSRWSMLANNQDLTVLISNTKPIPSGSSAGRQSITKDSMIVEFFRLPSAPTNRSFQYVSDGKVLDSGSIQTVTLRGETFYGLAISSSAVWAAGQEKLTTGNNPKINYDESIANALFTKIFAIQDTATVTLPKVTITENGQLASNAVVGKSIAITNSAGKSVTSLTIKKDWITVSQDQSKPGTYSYALSTTGYSAVQDALKTPAAGKVPIYYDFNSPNQGSIVINAKAPVQASLNVTYVDQTSGKTISTDTSIKGTVGQKGTYSVKAPNGYQLATGQSKNLSYQITSDASDNLTVKVTPQASTDNSSKSNSSSQKESSKNNSSSSNATSTTNSSSQKTSKKPSVQRSSRVKPSSPLPTTPRHVLTSVPSDPFPTDGSKRPLRRSRASKAIPRGTATVVWIDDDTGQVIGSKVYNGRVGSRVPINYSEQMLDLVRAGYDILADATNGGNMHFQPGATVYQIHLSKQNGPFNRHLDLAFDSHPSTSASNLVQSPVASKVDPSQPKNKVYDWQHRSPIVFDQSIAEFLEKQANDGGGNGDRPNDPSLGRFFKALSGTVNF